MDTLAIATDRNIVREITNRFIARPELGQTTTADRSRADLSMVDSRGSISRGSRPELRGRHVPA